MSSALRKTKLRLEEKGKKLTLEWTKMFVSVANDGAVAGESEWVGVCVRGDKNDVKRYSSEIRDLCKPLARTEADFMECVFAEFIATVADQALSGSAKTQRRQSTGLCSIAVSGMPPMRSAPYHWSAIVADRGQLRR